MPSSEKAIYFKKIIDKLQRCDILFYGGERDEKVAVTLTKEGSMVEKGAVGKIVEEGLDKYRDALGMILVAKLEALYGGPREWPKGISPTSEEDHETLVDVWNEAVKKAIDIVMEGQHG